MTDHEVLWAVVRWFRGMHWGSHDSLCPSAKGSPCTCWMASAYDPTKVETTLPWDTERTFIDIGEGQADSQPHQTRHPRSGSGPVPPDPPDPLTDERRHAPDPLRSLLLDLYVLVDTGAPETSLRDLLVERRPFIHLILTNGRG